jgi:hypothetical protein
MTSKKLTNLPVRKRKIHDLISNENYPDVIQSADSNYSSPCKKTKDDSNSILDIALSLTGLSSFKNKHQTKQVSQKFPETLMTILSDERHIDSIRWVPGKDLFFFVDSTKFTDEVLPQYFRKTKFVSFTRRLSRWGFRQVKKGSHAGCFFHPLFLQGNKELSKEMVSPSNSFADLGKDESPAGDCFKTNESEVAIYGREFLPIKEEIHLLHHHDQFSRPSSASHNNTSTFSNHNSNLACNSSADINKLMMLKKQMLTNCTNPKMALFEANRKNIDMEKLYMDRFNNIVSSQYGAASVIAKTSSRMSYVRVQESLIKRELLRSKFGILNQESLPYFISHKSSLIRRHLFGKKQLSGNFPKQMNHPKHALSSCGMASVPQPSSDEVIRRAMEVLYNR